MAWSPPSRMTSRSRVSPGGRTRAAKSGCSIRCPAPAKCPAWRFIGSTTRAMGSAACRSRGGLCGATATNGNPCRKGRASLWPRTASTASRSPRVTTDAVRLEVQLRKGFSGGILQWRLKAAADVAGEEMAVRGFSLGFPCRRNPGIIRVMWGRESPASQLPSKFFAPSRNAGDLPRMSLGSRLIRLI